MTHSLPIGAILLMSRTHSPNIGMSERMYARTHVRMYVYVCACVRRVYDIGSTILMSSSCDSTPVKWHAVQSPRYQVRGSSQPVTV
jgi:hypothetical protein